MSKSLGLEPVPAVQGRLATMPAKSQPAPPLSLRDEVISGKAALGQSLQSIADARRALVQWSDAHDGWISSLWTTAIENLPGAEAFSLVATGGWGRRELAPYSDIDFIVLAPSASGALASRVADQILYPLWDAGISVGHAVRDPASAARLAREDLASATALLDARHIAGDPAITDDLHKAMRVAVAPGGNPNVLVNRLEDDRKRRHDRFGDSLYLLEPNLKQGIGALRDLSTGLWSAAARWGTANLEHLVQLGHLSPRQADLLGMARDFVLALRVWVQVAAGRRTDQLTFELQEAIGPRLYPNPLRTAGDARPAVAPAVEALMRDYYLHARSIVRVVDRLVEMARVPARKKPQMVRVDRTFLIFNGALAVHDPKCFREDPLDVLRIFRVAAQVERPLYGHTRELIAETVETAQPALAGDPEASRLFLDALTDPSDAGQPSLLEWMHRLGVLGLVIPEFVPCTCRVQHDLYHVYTVDQHQLYAVAMLKRLARGELDGEHPVVVKALNSVTRLAPLYLATLLHDVGKPLGKGHAEKGAVIAERVARRLGLSEADASLASFLVRQHLTMAHVSQRRDLSDPDVIARFADKVGDYEHLAQLYVLTVCDTAMTSPGNLSAWKSELLSELFERTRAVLAPTAVEELAPVMDAEYRERVAAAVGVADEGSEGQAGAERERVFAWIDAFDERFVAALSHRQLARHVKLGLAREAAGTRTGVAVSEYALKGHSEVAMIAADAPGVLSVFAGVLAMHRIDVLAAVVGRADFGGHSLATDLFFVRDQVGRAIPVDDPRWEKLRVDLERLTAGGHAYRDLDAALARTANSGLPERVTPAVETEIRVDNDASGEATVVEVFTRDRPGVLYAITRALSRLGLDIHLSKVGTEGEKVADVFYVTRVDGEGVAKKIEDEADVAVLIAEVTAGVQGVGES